MNIYALDVVAFANGRIASTAAQASGTPIPRAIHALAKRNTAASIVAFDAISKGLTDLSSVAKEDDEILVNIRAPEDAAKAWITAGCEDPEANQKIRALVRELNARGVNVLFSPLDEERPGLADHAQMAMLMA